MQTALIWLVATSRGLACAELLATLGFCLGYCVFFWILLCFFFFFSVCLVIDFYMVSLGFCLLETGTY